MALLNTTTAVVQLRCTDLDRDGQFVASRFLSWLQHARTRGRASVLTALGRADPNRRKSGQRCQSLTN